ncbi:response regulator transcription factor [Paenibacillus alkalitolerans]|uniref:response regulator transcription factor n=1 Tax=Paenibacillus alkalitolerans TaxID=2799335 RepID=UPI0018F3890A|nr:response regulator [Paenibacillus alkalitolerans]
MFRVIIVDDEPVIRFGIKASVDWEREGFRVTGDYANGADALEAMKAAPADILITDIKMPLMDGLTLTRRALEFHPQLKVILVSSYSEFDYVREGLKLGVADYILKPTLEPEDLLDVVKKCSEKIREEARLESRLIGVRSAELERRRRSYEQGLKRYLIDKSDGLPADSPSWLNEPYAAVYVMLNRVNALEETYGFLHKSIVLDQLVDALYRRIPEGIAFPAAENELFLLLPGGGEHLSNELVLLKMALEEEIGTTVSLGYDTGEDADGVKSCFHNSKAACGRRFFEGEGIYRYESMIRNAERDDRHLPMMVQTVPSHSGDQLCEIIGRWRSRWSSGGKSPSALKEEACRVLSMLFKHSADPYALVESFDRMFKSETLEELCELLEEQALELRKHNSDNVERLASHNPVDKALEFIREHYLEPLTLQQVADYVHVSKNYFSILFKKTTEQNFIDFIIHLRIEKAKELLAGTDLKIYEVAERSGFNDVKYFSKLFKKMSGLTPIEYRDNHILRS